MMRRKAPPPHDKHHQLDMDRIDDLLDVHNDEIAVIIWCRTHERYECHDLPLEFVKRRFRYNPT
jgi:hypothetical protein